MRLRDVQMHGVVYAPDANGGPGVPKMELDRDMLNCVWQANQNLPGLAAFSMARYNPKLSQISFMQDHLKLFREDSRTTTTVFAGKIIKPDLGQGDAIVRCWDYKAFLQRSRTGFRTLYPSKLIGTEIVAPEWAAAVALTNSPFAFVATGTIEDPLGLDNVTPIKTNASFGVVDFNRLFTFNALSEMAMANTNNNVVFDISRDTPHTFSFQKNRSAQITKYAVSFPGNVVTVDYGPGFDQYRNDLATVILDPTTGAQSEYTLQSADANTTPYRRLQDAVTVRTLLGATGATEADQGKAALNRLLNEGIRIPELVAIQTRQGEITPFDGWDIGDTIRTTIQKADKSGDEYDGYLRIISAGASWTPTHGELLQLYARAVP